VPDATVARYPEWQAYLRTQKPPTLVVWGKNDPIFTTEGARAFQRDLPEAELHLVDTGHFALQEDFETIAALMRDFYVRRVRGAARRASRAAEAA
jgi:pimeloyl-ACP methyl ester carboxylesterase